MKIVNSILIIAWVVSLGVYVYVSLLWVCLYKQLNTEQVKFIDVSAIEVPVKNVIEQGEPTQRQSVTGFRTKGAEPSIATTGDNNVFIGHEAGVNATGGVQDICTCFDSFGRELNNCALC